MKTTTTPKLTVWTRKVPGAEFSVVAECETMAQAEAAAARYEGRKDLRHQDVIIRLGRDGERVKYAGPPR